MNGPKEEFRQEVIEYILSKYPEWRVTPKDDFAISVEVSGKPGSINLHNIYHQVKLGHQPKQVLIQHFISEFVGVIGNSDKTLDSFGSAKNTISLVVRPPDLYKEDLADSYDKQLAFSLPVLPDLALYWVIDNANSWRYVPNSEFSRWNIHSGEATWWAYENTCKAEACMNTGKIGEIGLLISTNRKSGTISHLLYDPRNLQGLIQRARPDWPEQPYWICVPVPGLIVITKKGHDETIKEISLVAHGHYGKALSNRIYTFFEDNFTGEVMHQPNQKESTVVDLNGRIPGAVLPD